MHPYIQFSRPPVILNRVIGKGTHGTVYEGYHTRIEHRVAVKKVKDTPSARREIVTLMELQRCPHVVRYYNTYADEDTDNLWIVMELCKGTDGDAMVQQVRRGRPFTEEQLRHMSQGMANAVLHCHEHGVLHGDIKPPNVIFTRKLDPIMIDFGCARHGDAFSIPLGTPLYFAPEKFAYDFGLASDTWSLGVLMYMLVAGHHPFVHVPSLDSHRVGIVDLQTEIEATRLDFHHPHWDMISDHMKGLLSEMLQKDPAKRIPIEDVITHKWWCANL